MKSKLMIQTCAVEVDGTWFPCEYLQSKARGVCVLSLGDVERENPDARPVYVRKTLSEAAADFLRQVSPNRKLVLLTPNDSSNSEEWPCKQALKRELGKRACALSV